MKSIKVKVIHLDYKFTIDTAQNINKGGKDIVSGKYTILSIIKKLYDSTILTE